MVLRHDAAGVLAIGQPAHAVLCGRFARAWGNARFHPAVPLDDVALGAEQHDVGWATADLHPDFDPATGYPRDFMQTPLRTGAALWAAGPPALRSQSRWASLLATMHGRRLYERIDLTGRPAGDRAAVTALLTDLAADERMLTAVLRADPDPGAAALAGADEIARNSDLVWTWDVLSLALLLDWAPHTLRGVPTAAGGGVDVELRAVGPQTLSLSPWPFADPHGLTVHTEGRRLHRPSPDAAAMRAAFAAAPFETVRFHLVPLHAAPRPDDR